jgi:hypothetical protein
VATREEILDALRGAAASNVEPIDEDLYRRWAAEHPGAPSVDDVVAAFGSFGAALSEAGIRWDPAAQLTSPERLERTADPPPGVRDPDRH